MRPLDAVVVGAITPSLVAAGCGGAIPSSDGSPATLKLNGRAIRLLPSGVDMVLPGATTVAWLAFLPPAPDTQPGIWKLGLYEMPVKTNDVGRASKTARFEFRYKAVEYIDTYQQDNFFAIPKLIGTAEVPPKQP